MSRFSYSAKDLNGQIKKETIIAENDREFNEKMHEKGLFVSEYKKIASDDENKTVHKFKTKELAFNSRQLSAMLSSGLTLVKSIDILCREQESEKAKNIWRDIYEQVQKGESFSAALEMQGGAFPPFFTSMVNAGESSGSLDVVMKRLSEHYAKENKMNNTIKGALIYPTILFVLTIAVVIIIFTFIMPTFKGMFSEENQMPFLASVLMAISDFLVKRWYLIVVAVIGLIMGTIYALKQPQVRYKIDTMLIKGPQFGPLIIKIYTGRFSRTLSSLYSSGIPMVECLQRSSAILNNKHVDEKFLSVIDEVKQGEPLSAAIQRTEIFDSMFCSIIFVGEESGALDDILEKTADYYEEESESAVQRLVGLLEPIMIIFLGIVIGLVLGGVFPAIYKSFEGIS